jgi:hypothetical protein|tara:strand:+ start:112 stop:273 length:162 start_codon:yes stop_codon:yes gene_type:complete
MSWASKWIERQIKKRGGTKGAILWFAGKVVKVTPTKKDDEMYNKLKQLMEEFK